MIKLDNPFHAEFSKANNTHWVTLDSGKVAGEVRAAGGAGLGAGNYTYVEVYEAGLVDFARFNLLRGWFTGFTPRHMVPYDQPEAALDLFTRWITDTPLSLASNGTSVV